MTVNYRPRFAGGADFQGSVTLTSANTTKDGTGSPTLLYTAPTDGALVHGVLAMPLGTNVASVLRVWANNGSTPNTATNNMMVGQASLPATTNSEVAGLFPIFIPFPVGMQDMAATHRIYVAIGTAVAAGWMVSACAQKFAAP